LASKCYDIPLKQKNRDRLIIEVIGIELQTMSTKTLDSLIPFLINCQNVSVGLKVFRKRIIKIPNIEQNFQLARNHLDFSNKIIN